MFNDANFLDKHVCSFCDALVPYNKVLLGTGDACICEDCIDLYYDILNIEKDEEVKVFDGIITPKRVYNELSKTVIGQNEAKKILSVALINHYKRIKYGLDVEKSNVLMIGPSGCGKTLLAKTLAKIIDVPFAIVDATVYTEAGYVGEDVENILLRLLQNANFDKEKAEKGIVFIDEIDKLSRKSESTSITRDVSGEGVQNSLLKIIEGNTINIPPTGGRKHPYQEYITFDTSNVLFICAGAFHISKVEDLIPEFQGRFPIRVELDNLTAKEFYKILTEPKNAITLQYQELLKVDNINLIFKEEALKEIANYAEQENESSENLGARRLHTVMEMLLEDISFNASGDHPLLDVVIDKEYVSKAFANFSKEHDLRKYVL